MESDQLLYQIALSDIPGVGDVIARKLISHIGSAEKVLKESYKTLTKVNGIGSYIAKTIIQNKSLERAEEELKFIKKFDIQTSYIGDSDYPRRLKECPDAPILLYYKGNLHHNATKILSIVGTRNITERGKSICQTLIRNLSEKYPKHVIISGLAYGVDICSHKAALKNNLSTIGVMAHGFKTLYPSAHTNIAREMLNNGCLLTDFLSDAPPDRNNFLKRNRIIAGLADATIIIESGVKGGSMVTADIATSYNRDVFAIPGFPNEEYSAGCNMLIKSQKAALIESEKDIEYFLNWKMDAKSIPIQTKIIPALSKNEQAVYDLILKNRQLSTDKISSETGIPIQHLSSALLTLEFAGLVALRPGNIYILKK